MDKVFDIYLSKLGQIESDAYAELSLPATPYQLLDALDKLQLAEGEELYWEITGYHGFEELSSVLDESCGLHDLNALARKLSELDEQQSTAFAGLLQMEQAKGGPIHISRLIDLAYSTECCHVVGEALNDPQLGRFCAEHGFVPGVEDLPDAVFALLDFEKIGRDARLDEGGVFVERSMEHPGGYVVQHSELRQAYKTMELTLRKPAYTILAETFSGDQVAFPFPANEPMGTEPVRCVDCAAPSLIGSAGGVETVDLLARRLAAMEPNTLTAYKALLEIMDCKDIQDAGTLMDLLDQYIFSPQYSSPMEVAKGELTAILPEPDAELLIPCLNLYLYGEGLLQRRGSVLTSYGLIERKDGQPIQTAQVQPQRGGMEMV